MSIIYSNMHERDDKEEAMPFFSSSLAMRRYGEL